ncbi:MAG: uracil-DNA glycosylase [Oscillospiraceae bacterium]|nr:uracil-DNA glycosylase [Oscillospiraceae bacterium]
MKPTKPIGNAWDEILAPIFASAEYQKFREFLKYEYTHHTIFPDMFDIFNALKLAPPDKLKVVILGQDPYINQNQAHGLAFSVQPPEPPPPSLVNIFKEIKSDLGIENEGRDGSLINWAQQGVLLLNSVLTVRSGLSNSHKQKGWEQLTSAVINHILTLEQPIVFMLWGRNAQQVFDNSSLPTSNSTLVLKAPHPSPLSAHSGFFGCRHFSKCNEFLAQHNLTPIDWS